MKRFKKPSDIRAAVVGYGGAFNMGKAHLLQMKKVGMTPTAVVEIDPARHAVAKQDFAGIATFSSVGEMLEKSDANLVTLITPHNTHAKLALQCLRAKRHVVTEKPFAITTAECDSMIAAAKKANVMVSTYHNRHWDGCMLRAVKQINEKKIIGDVFRINANFTAYAIPREWWRSIKSVSGGVLYDWGVHLIEYALQLIDSPIVEVSGYAHKGYWQSKAAKKSMWRNDANEDEGFVVVRFANGAWLTLTISTLDANPKPCWLEITGTKGTYTFNANQWNTYQPGAKAIRHRTGKNPTAQGICYYQNIVDHMTKGTKLVITPQYARRPIHIIDLACRSATKGCSIKAKYK